MMVRLVCGIGNRFVLATAMSSAKDHTAKFLVRICKSWGLALNYGQIRAARPCSLRNANMVIMTQIVLLVIQVSIVWTWRDSPYWSILLNQVHCMMLLIVRSSPTLDCRDTNSLEFWKIIQNQNFHAANVKKISMELITVRLARGKGFFFHSAIRGIKLWQVLSWPAAKMYSAGPQMAIDWSRCRLSS